MPLHLKSDDVKESKVTWTSPEQGEGSMAVKKAYGNEASMMIATRAPGYHTRPHRHISEQINYVLDGEIWFFVEDKGFLCKKGDFQRIPSNVTHWAYNCSEQPAVVAETHAPALLGREGDAGLFDDEETPNVKGPGVNEFVPFDPDTIKRIERAYIDR